MPAKSKSFLDAIKKADADGRYAGDEFGGGAGADGSGLPTGVAGNFMFATGIEPSNPTIDHGKTRRDLLEETGHYDHYKQDFQLVHDLGLKVLRYHLPYFKVNPKHGVYDWDFADAAMGEIRRLGITPILDLMHFGVPDWVGDFQNPELPVLFAEYAAAVADRYPWVRFWTPVNEIFVTAKFSALEGIWNEQLKTPAAFVTAIKHAVAASVLATHEIARRRPDCVIVQAETAEYVHQACATESDEVRLINKLRFLPLDLLFAHPPDAEVCMYLLDHGMTRPEFDWNMRGEPPGYQVMGNDYYGRNEKMRLPDGTVTSADDVLGWYQITKEYYLRYRKPVMHTETNVMESDECPTWIWKQWLNVLRMRKDGVPVLGFTWYSLIDQVDWDIGLEKKVGTVNPVGLYDLKRNPRPVAAAYRQLLETFGQITIVPHGEMFEITGRQAKLKVEV